MVKRDLEKERQVELAAIWGGETDGEHRYPRRRRGASKKEFGASAGTNTDEVTDEVLSDVGSDALSEDRGLDGVGEKIRKKKKTSSTKKNSSAYRLHCFVGPGTERNAVRTVFEAYEPKVELRTSQKGNLLNKTHFAVLTFRNKAMALHAVKLLDGTDQRDLLGVKELKLRLMLSRKEHSKARQRIRKRLREDHKKRLIDEVNEDTMFFMEFLEKYAPSPMRRVRNKNE